MAWAGPVGRGCLDLSALISTKLGWLGGKAEHCCTVGAGGRGGGCDQREDCGHASRVCILSPHSPLLSPSPVAKWKTVDMHPGSASFLRPALFLAHLQWQSFHFFIEVMQS